MQKLIPKKLRIGTRWYSVDKVRHMARIGTMGQINYGTATITLATHSNMRDLRFRYEAVYDTFWHEVTHAILKDMGSKLEKNERFVNAFSTRLTKAILSARF